MMKLASLKRPLLRTMAITPLMVVLLLTTLALNPIAVHAGPPTAADNIDYEASGFMMPPGVTPASWATAAGGMNYASRPAAFDPRMAGQVMMPNGPRQGGPMMGGQMPMPQMPPTQFAGMPGARVSGTMPPGAVMSPNAVMASRTQMPSAPLMPMPNAGPNGVIPTGLQAPIGHAAYQAAMQAPYGAVMPVGFQSACDAAGCDGCASCAMGGYETSYCGDSSCGCSTGSCGGGGFKGLLPALMAGGGDPCGCGGSGCGSCMSRLKSRGSSCLGEGGMLGDMKDGNCGFLGDMQQLAGMAGGSALGCLNALKPYGEAGACAQRWYDVSVEAVVLGQSISATPGNLVVANFGNGNAGVANNPALLASSATDTGLELGGRIRMAFIAGAGGSIELGYMGGHEWEGSSSVRQVDGLTSFLSQYGLLPLNGFETLDTAQSISSKVAFHSAELNYRRRTVMPNCKFQGSWLVGLRYMRLDNDLDFQGEGNTGGIQLFNYNTNIDNEYFGAQAGFDFWYNIYPGIRMGVGLKGAWVQQDWERDVLLSTSLDGATLQNNPFANDGTDGTLITDLEYQIIYRLSHSWAFRSSYQLLHIKDVVAPTFSRSALVNAGNALDLTTNPAITESSATIQGFTLGAEYTW